MFIGNQHLVSDFKNLIKAGKLAHSYLFFGEPQVGKMFFAKRLASFLETGDFELTDRPLSDYLVVNGGFGEGGIDFVRNVKFFLSQKPVFSLRRTVIIDGAENLTAQAQNAILKIAEEPPQSALIILISNQQENLLTALQSRFQKIYFSRVPNEEIINFLIKNYNLTKTKASDIAEKSFGRIGRAIAILDDKDFLEAGKWAESFLKSGVAARSKMIKELVDIYKENPVFFDRVFENIIIYLRKDKCKNVEILKETMHRLFLMKNFNTNKRLQIEALNW